MECKRLRMLPVEVIVRGYLAGSGWKDYQASGATSGHRLPEGLRESDQLPEPIFTPSTKAETGHDENISREQAASLLGEERMREVERVAIALYTTAVEYARGQGIIIADTKFELGLDEQDNLVLGDEALTPDSSRFWPADAYEPGRPQDSFDKQYVRDYCESTGWDKTYPGPELPEDVVMHTRSKYIEAFERLTKIPFEAYVERPSVVFG
jgi:phosphoribosylaminoimidazole-succinocarboxamide synthase